MELDERLDLTLVNYLNKLDFDEFKLYCKSSCKNDAERRIQYNILKNFCAANIKAKGVVRKIYAYTLKTPNEVGGRLYCGKSIQGLSSKIRGFLCKHMTDIDMKNCHPMIAQWLCKKHKIDCPNLSYYIENRTEILNRFDKNGKTLFLCALNDDKLNKRVTDTFFKNFDKECKIIQSKLTSIEEYADIVKTVPADKAHNWNGSAVNRIFCSYENKILREVISVLNSKQIEIGVLMFDGLMVYGNYYDQPDILREIEIRVNSVFENLNMKFDYKEHDTTIVLPEETDTYDDERSNDDSYSCVKKEFEKNHCKIVEKALFVKHTNQDVIFFTAPKFKTAYEHLKYMDYSTNPPSKHAFIDKWVKDECILRYDDVGVYPPPLICPKNVFNLWKPFWIETLEGDYERDEEGLQMFINHLKILCNNAEDVTTYIFNWMGQMFQFPAVKTVVPTFISEPGAGKGTLVELLTKMMGNKKILITAEPSKTVWGSFNGQMSECFFVNLNEMSMKETTDAEGQIKVLITDPTMNINQKGINSYSINSFHRFLITTNNSDPIKVKKGDRRNVVIRSSDEKVGDKEYFKLLRERFERVNTMRTIYDALMALPDLENFGSIKRPETEHIKEMKEKSRENYDRWIEYMVRFNANEKQMKFLGSEQYDLFRKWCSHNDPKYETTNVKLAINIKRLNIDGIKCAVKGKLGNYTVYDIEKLKVHYKTDEVDKEMIGDNDDDSAIDIADS